MDEQIDKYDNMISFIQHDRGSKNNNSDSKNRIRIISILTHSAI